MALRRIHTLLLIALFWLVMGLGARGLDADSIWYDEFYSIFYAGGDGYGPYTLSQTWTAVAEGIEWTPPGYHLSLTVWGGVVGWTPFATRALSLFGGLVGLALAYRFARDIGGWRVGLAAAVILGGGAFFITYLHEMRTYALHASFTALFLTAYWRTIQEPKIRPMMPFLLFIGTVGMLYTHYFSIFSVAAVALYHLLFVPKNRRWWLVPIVMGGAGMTFLPWLDVAFRVLGEANSGVWKKDGSMDWEFTLRTLAHSFSNGSTALLALLGFFALMPLFSGKEKAKPAPHSVGFVWWVSIVFIALMLLVNALVFVMAHIRYALALWIPLAALAGIGVDQLRRRGLPMPLILGIWIIGGIWNSFDNQFIDSIYGTFRHLPFRELAAEAATYADGSDSVVMHSPDFPHISAPVLEHYLRHIPARSSMLYPLPGEVESVSRFERYKELIGGADRLWLALDYSLPAQERFFEFKNELLRQYHHCYTAFDTRDMRLDLYIRRDFGDMMHFGDSIRARLLTSIPESKMDTLNLLIGWHIDASVPPQTFNAALHVLDANGALVMQDDYSLNPSEFFCAPSAISLDGLAPGEYSLSTIVYDWQTLQRLPAEYRSSGQRGEALKIGSFRVE